MPYGYIKRIVREHGFGFIVDEAGMDWFFVRDGARDSFDQLSVNEQVGFSGEWTPKGPRAIDIHYAQPE